VLTTTTNSLKASIPYLIVASVSFTKDAGTTSRAETVRLRLGTDTSGTLLAISAGSSAAVASSPYGSSSLIYKYTPGANGNVSFCLTAQNFASSTVSANNIHIEIVELTGVAGPQGVQGPLGPAGDTGATGATGPAGPQGEVGPTGAAGPAGSDGSKWYSGSGVPSGTTGVDSDMYVDTASGDLYQKSVGAWSVVDNITGPQGTQGTQGIQGIQGDPGPQGAQGIQGIQGVQGW
jgi:hypothetical protein